MTLDTLKEKAESLLHLCSFVERTEEKNQEKKRREDEQLEINNLHSFLSHQ
jgi:hypothetical protein